MRENCLGGFTHKPSNEVGVVGANSAIHVLKSGYHGQDQHHRDDLGGGGGRCRVSRVTEPLINGNAQRLDGEHDEKAAREEEAPRSPSQEQESRTPFMVSLTDLKWVELPERKGMQFTILSGDPKTGPYTQMRKVRAGTDNGLHSHSSEIKNVIISGVWYTGPDAASAKDFGPGSVVYLTERISSGSFTGSTVSNPFR